MSAFSEIFDMIKALSPREITAFKRELVAFLNTSITATATLAEHTEELRFVNGRVCPICGSVQIVRNGRRADGKQRFVCRDCGKGFVINTNAITAGTHKELDIWEKYIDCMMNGFSIRKTAEICKISKNTAFNWRHKILDALQNMQNGVLLNGIVEADETFFPDSYKGNHKHSKTFTMPRPARHRGSSIHQRGLSKEQVCVMCAVNRNGLSYAKIGKLGKVNKECVERAFNSRIQEFATLCTDKEKAYNKFADNNNLLHFQLDENQSKKGIYNIQRINNYHSRLKAFLKPFNGVATKYLNNYIVWFNLVKFAKETDIEKQHIFLDFVLSTAKSVKCRTLSDRPNLPLLVA